MRNAWSNDFGALPVRCNVLHPWEDTVKIHCVPSWIVADGIESISGKPVQ